MKTSSGAFRRPLPSAHTFDLIADATAEAVRPVAFSVLVIIVALIPLFTMQGVPGKVFAPMSETYGFALIGAFLFAIFFAPVLCFVDEARKTCAATTRVVVNWLEQTLRRRHPLDHVAPQGGPRHRGIACWPPL